LKLFVHKRRYTAGAASTGAMPISYTMNEIVATLPAGCINPNVNDKSYYLCGNTWFQPSYGANGLYYRVVPTPTP
jgi:hypothetical protein